MKASYGTCKIVFPLWLHVRLLSASSKQFYIDSTALYFILFLFEQMLHVFCGRSIVLFVVLRVSLVSNDTHFQVINNSQFRDNERQSAILLIAQTSEMFRKVTIGPLDTATLQAQFLQSLVEHSQYMCIRPLSHIQHNPNRGCRYPGIQDPASVSSENLTQYTANSEINIDGTTTIPCPTTRTDANVALTSPHNIMDVDVSNLDGITWDEAC